MPRPVKCRKVCHFPNVLEFLPADGTEKSTPIVLTVDEYETIRLLDKMKKLTGKKILLVAVALCAFGFAKAQDTQAEKNILTLTLDKAALMVWSTEPAILASGNRLCQASLLATFFKAISSAATLIVGRLSCHVDDKDGY